MQSFLSQAKHATPMDESYVGQRNDSTAILFPYIPLIFYTMHLLYEDLKLDGMMTAYLPALAEFLYQLAIDLQLECYCLHYFLDHPKVAYLTSNSFITDSETKQLQNQHYFSGEVPSIFKHVYGLLTSVNEGVPVTQDGYPYMSNVNDLSKRVVQVSYLIVSGSIDVTACIKWVFPQAGFGATNRRRPLSVATMVVDVESTAIPNNDVDLLYKQVVYTLIDLGMTRKDIERLPMALHYFFAEALEHMRKTPPIERGAKAYELLLRPELLAHGKPDTNGKSFKKIDFFVVNLSGFWTTSNQPLFYHRAIQNRIQPIAILKRSTHCLRKYRPSPMSYRNPTSYPAKMAWNIWPPNCFCFAFPTTCASTKCNAYSAAQNRLTSTSSSRLAYPITILSRNKRNNCSSYARGQWRCRWVAVCSRCVPVHRPQRNR